MPESFVYFNIFNTCIFGYGFLLLLNKAVELNEMIVDLILQECKQVSKVTVQFTPTRGTSRVICIFTFFKIFSVTIYKFSEFGAVQIEHSKTKTLRYELIQDPNIFQVQHNYMLPFIKKL